MWHAIVSALLSLCVYDPASTCCHTPRYVLIGHAHLVNCIPEALPTNIYTLAQISPHTTRSVASLPARQLLYVNYRLQREWVIIGWAIEGMCLVIIKFCDWV